MVNTTIERLVEIENEREQTMMDKQFQQWMKKLNVSRLYTDKTGVIKANELMNQYDLSKYKYIVNL
jgi:Tfp pilus assembly pilus retraction ATPase PilT